MFHIFIFVCLLWVLAAFLRWLFRDRLPLRLQARWILIVSAVSAFVVAEAELAMELEPLLHLLYFAILASAWILAGFLMPRLREQMVNIAILLILLVPAITFIYLRSDLRMVVYYLLSVVTGVLLYLSFRDEPGVVWAEESGDSQRGEATNERD